MHDRLKREAASRGRSSHDDGIRDSSVRDDEVPTDFRGEFRRDRIARELYAEGAGISRSVPSAVAVPVDSADVANLARWSRATGHALIPRGSGSGMAAGAVGPDVMVDLSRLKSVGDLDVSGRRVRVSTGAIRKDVDTAARRHGLRFPVDPSSGAFCTIGGMTATNAAGARTLHFGAMRDWVTGIRCVFDDGSDVWVRRGENADTSVPAVARLLSALQTMRGRVTPGCLVHAHVRKESSGYDIARALKLQTSGELESGTPGHTLGSQRAQGSQIDLIDLLVGSEGTLAIFTEIELALTPVAQATATLLAQFHSLEAATEAATHARESGAVACELLDRTFLAIAASQLPSRYDLSAEAILIAEVEAESPAAARSTVEILAQRFRVLGAHDVQLASDTRTERELWELRHAASPIMARLAPQLRSMQFIEDGCVPPSRLPEYVRAVRKALKMAETSGVIFGHAGDAHIHVNPLVDVTHKDWRDRVRRLMDTVCEATANLGGTLAGEHGDGRLRAPLLPRVWNDEARAAFANVKHAADPAGVLNPGCKVALAGTASMASLASLKFDPEAESLDPRVRTVLDGIERERRWSTYRLDESVSFS